jgi:hypothetical protein
LAKLGKSVEEVEDGRAELALGTVEGGVNNLLAQVFPEALNQVQVGRIWGQKHLANRLVGLRPGVGLASAWQGTGVVSLEVKPSRCNRSVRPERE